jgi:hypothetical protein
VIAVATAAAEREEAAMPEDPEFWFNTTTGQVEEGAQSPSHQLMGPYPTAEQAARALEIAARRTQAADDEDEAWDDFQADDR